MELNFDFVFESPEWMRLGIMFFAGVVVLWARFIPIWKAGSSVKIIKTDRDEDDEDTNEEYETREYDLDLPKVSVIVYNITDEDDTLSYLEMLMNQDYPDYEVILVNEGTSETTASLAERLVMRYPDKLYVTFIPAEAYNLSRRKLAITIGMKAARGEIAVTTMSNSIIPSQQWLREITDPIASDDNIDISLGYSHIPFSDLNGVGKWYRDMDTLLTSCQWIGAAASGHPYRGDGCNLAIRRQLFFESKGYSKSMHLVNGDDDVFLKEIMDSDNTVVSISKDSILVNEWGESAGRISKDLKERYMFTSRFLPFWPFMRAGIGSFAQWIMFGAGVAASVEGLPSVDPALMALGIGLAVCLTEIAVYRRTAGRLQSPRLWWSLPWFLLWHPLGNMIFRLRRRRHRRKNYTFA